MEKDTHKTKVLFLIDKLEFIEKEPEEAGEQEAPSIFAFFPEYRFYHEEHPNHKTVFTCYQHVGQHSACSIEYTKHCPPASPEQYKDLFDELESIGYNLEVLN
jgi:hypothetical protein